MTGIEATQHQEDSLNKMLVASLALHLLVILFFTLRAVFFPDSIPIYRPAIRVDLVGLPSKRNPEKQLAQKEEKRVAPVKPAPTLAKPETAALKKEESLALNKLKTMSAIEKLKNMKDASKEEPKKQNEVIRGNKVSAGQSLQGLAKIDFNTYIGSLDAKVKNHWALPEWMNSLNLHAIVLVKLDKSGQITEKTFVQKSGNSDFDTRVMLAIEQALPFDPPPAKLVDLIATQGIEFAFPE